MNTHPVRTNNINPITVVLCSDLRKELGWGHLWLSMVLDQLRIPRRMLKHERFVTPAEADAVRLYARTKGTMGQFQKPYTARELARAMGLDPKSTWDAMRREFGGTVRMNRQMAERVVERVLSAQGRKWMRKNKVPVEP